MCLDGGLRLRPKLLDKQKASLGFRIRSLLVFSFFVIAGGMMTVAGAATPTPTPRFIGDESTEKRETPNPTSAVAAATPTASETPARHVELRLHGSNTIGKELSPALVEEMLKSAGATSIQRHPGAKEDETDIDAILPEESGQKVTFEIQAHGSATAFEDLLAGKCDIGMASRQVKPDEAEKCAAAGLGDMFSPACENVLGLDGIAVLVHHSNPVDSLTKQQIADIFTGRITDWSQIPGGNPGPIHLYRRDDKSGTFDTFKSVVLGGGAILGSATKYEDSEKLSDTVANDPNGIGFTGLPFVRSAKALAVSESGSSPLLPNPFTVSTEDYPISRRLFLYIPAVPQNKWTRRFVEFALSAAGQSVVGNIGFISQTVEKTKPEIPTHAPRTYVKQTSGAWRLNLDFRFNKGVSQLDTKALRDLDRVIQFLSKKGNQGTELLLLGFADNTGTKAGNLALSKERASAVADKLRTRGITPTVVTGYGQELPVASNETEPGREKNRRVEVWVR
jgi:phosphate transport system substrate-binding protein